MRASARAVSWEILIAYGRGWELQLFPFLNFPVHLLSAVSCFLFALLIKIENELFLSQLPFCWLDPNLVLSLLFDNFIRVHFLETKLILVKTLLILDLNVALKDLLVTALGPPLHANIVWAADRFIAWTVHPFFKHKVNFSIVKVHWRQRYLAVLVPLCLDHLEHP